MEEKHAIEVTDLVISYQNLKKTSIKKNLLHFNRQKADRFVAVKGISFYVREGEILGIIANMLFCFIVNPHFPFILLIKLLYIFNKSISTFLSKKV